MGTRQRPRSLCGKTRPLLEVPSSAAQRGLSCSVSAPDAGGALQADKTKKQNPYLTRKSKALLPPRWSWPRSSPRPQCAFLCAVKFKRQHLPFHSRSPQTKEAPEIAPTGRALGLRRTDLLQRHLSARHFPLTRSVSRAPITGIKQGDIL